MTANEMVAQIDALGETLRNGNPDEQQQARAQLEAIAKHRGSIGARARTALKETQQ